MSAADVVRICSGGDYREMLESQSEIVNSELMRWFFFFQAEDGIRCLVRSRGLGDVYKRQALSRSCTV